MGFEPYVKAIADFLNHSSTEPPLTLSIEGEWGSGKSSFMLQLEETLRKRKELTVNFNAWRHDKEEALWAAFALNFIHQISQDLSYPNRKICDLKLFSRRYKWKNGWLDMLRVVLIWLIIYGILVLAPILLYIKGFDWFISLTDNLIELNDNNQFSFIIKQLIGMSGIAASLGIIISLIIKLKNYVGNPLEINLNKYIHSPNYENRIAFIEHFHNDFKEIVDVYAGKNKVYVFIDDLDRCEVPKASDLMQALNLMISSDPRLIFIIGMDREKIAASFAVKHEKLLPYLSLQNPYKETLPNHTNNDLEGLEYGYTFIEKFIQLPFLIPKPNKEDLQHFLNELSAPETKIHGLFKKETNVFERHYEKLKDYFSKEDLQETNIDSETIISEEQESSGQKIIIKVTEDSQTIHDIVIMVAPALDNNPRRLKQFINLFRLRTFIANETGLFDYSEDSSIEECLTLEQLGKFVAISLKWPLLLANLESEPTLLKQLQEMAIGHGHLITNEIKSEALIRWSKQKKLMNLLSFGCLDNKSPELSMVYSLSKFDIEKLLKVSPRVVRPLSDSEFENKFQNGITKKLEDKISNITDLLKLMKSTVFKDSINEVSFAHSETITDPIKKLNVMLGALSAIINKLPENKRGIGNNLLKMIDEEPIIENKLSLIGMILNGAHTNFKMEQIENKLDELLFSIISLLSEELVIAVDSNDLGIEHVIHIPLQEISYPELKEDLEKIKGKNKL
ncbi:MAG: hypothetical protein KAT05_02765, partial [Spirochaetes bacterium]|nr:hypothetical protein [Spirochaetota bacterium]